MRDVSRGSLFVVLTCLVVASGMRVFHLRADPPPNLSPSGGYFADEGFWSHNARNKVLFDTWETDDWNDMWAAAPNHWLQYLSFSLLGVGLAQARVTSVALSVLLVLLCYWICRRHLPQYAWAAGTVLAATDFLNVMFGRLGLLETPTLVLLLAAAAVAGGARVHGRAAALGSGCLFILALATKRTVAYAGFGLVAASALSGRSRSVRWFAAGCGLASLAWLLYARGHLDAVVAYHRYYASQQVIDGSRLRHLVCQPLLSYLRPSLPLLVLGLCGALRVWRRWVGEGVRPRPLEAGSLVWLAGGILYLGLLGYRPLRYYVPLLAPLLLLGAGWLGAIGLPTDPARRGSAIRRFGATWCGAAAVGLLVLGSACEVAWPGWRRLAVGALALGCVAAMGAEALDRLAARSGPVARRAVFLCLVVGAVVWSVAAYVPWAARPVYGVYDASRDVARLPEGSVLTGQWSLELTLESRLRAIPVWKGFVNDDEPFRRFGITHATVWDRHMERYRSWYPERFERARILRRYQIKDSTVYLLELDGEGGAATLD
jgi:4-amino-4-deoxy-L-arabinose transferase-like glycosyltransferase